MARENAIRKDDTHDDEIVALLHQIGQRLVQNERERKQLRVMLGDLEEKADHGERAWLTVQDRLHKTESALEKRQKALEDAFEEQSARLEKAALMADRIEEALSQYARINRRLDKVAQDKARMIRKLDQIEETVIETREALHNGRDLVPLGGAKASDLDDDAPWWKGQATVRAAAVSAMVLLGLASGWAIGQMKTGDGVAVQDSSFETARADLRGNEPLAKPPSFEDADEIAPLPQEQQTAAQDAPDAQEPAVPAVPAPQDRQDEEQAIEAAEKAATEESGGDPMAMDDAQLLASLNDDPDALAAKLNDIVTGVGAAPGTVKDAAPAQETQASPVSLTPKNETRDIPTADFIKGQKDSRPLESRIQHDAALPAVIKEVEKKAFAGIPEAQHDLAAIYTAGHGGVKVEYGKAAAWFREAAVQGVANASYNLGVLYQQGLGVKQDINMAVRWYRAAAEKGHPEAEYNLGIASIEGVGTKYDPEKAAYYFEESAKGGIREAAYNLGLIHENGLAGNSRPDEALYWYKKAAEMGSPEAQAALDQLAKTLGVLPGEIDRLYGQKKDEEAAKPKGADAQEQAAPASQQSRAGYEYIEAEPLDSAPVLADIKESGTPPAAVDSAVIAQIQEQLVRLGLYPGPADGVSDNLTEDAIRAYQANFNLKQDGHPSQALLVHMMTSELGSRDE